MLRLKPWLSLKQVIWNNLESIGTKTYTTKEATQLFSSFSKVDAKPTITTYDCKHQPKLITQFYPDSLGWFLIVEAKK